MYFNHKAGDGAALKFRLRLQLWSYVLIPLYVENVVIQQMRFSVIIKTHKGHGTGTGTDPDP